VEVRLVARIVELEEVNVQLRTELDAAGSKLMKIERHGQVLASENKSLKKTWKMRVLHMTLWRRIRQKTERVKLQQF
jgi:hypothetical protein